MEAKLAESRHGVVSRRLLLEAGLSAAAIKRRVRSGALITVHPGVYRVGHSAPSREATRVKVSVTPRLLPIDCAIS